MTCTISSLVGLKMIDNTILAGDADTLYQFITEDIYSPEDLDNAEFLHKAALVGHTECVRVLLENDHQVRAIQPRCHLEFRTSRFYYSNTSKSEGTSNEVGSDVDLLNLSFVQKQVNLFIE